MDDIYEYIMANFFKSNEKIKAIKYYRDQTGMGLRESKEIVDSMFEGTYVTQTRRESVDDYVRTHFDESTKVKAIKYYRDQTGMGLRESKEIVDSILDGTYVTQTKRKYENESFNNTASNIKPVDMSWTWKKAFKLLGIPILVFNILAVVLCEISNIFSNIYCFSLYLILVILIPIAFLVLTVFAINNINNTKIKLVILVQIPIILLLIDICLISIIKIFGYNLYAFLCITMYFSSFPTFIVSIAGTAFTFDLMLKWECTSQNKKMLIEPYTLAKDKEREKFEYDEIDRLSNIAIKDIVISGIISIIIIYALSILIDPDYLSNIIYNII